MIATKQILTSHACSTDKGELKEFLVDETLSQICPMDKDKSKVVIVDKCSMEVDKSECVHKILHKQEDAKNET